MKNIIFKVIFFQSGKLVNKMFSRITEVVENKDVLVCVLIDEVESLAHARNQCVSGKTIFDLILNRQIKQYL